MQLKDIDMAPEELIIKNISDEELDDLLRKEITNKKVGGEQWFRKYENWYEMPAFVNPYKTPYHELRILIDHQKDLYQFTTGKIKIFWGVGIGDSEIIPVSWDLDTEGYSEVYVIDVVPHFIETFIQNLRNLTKEYPNSK